MNYQEKYQKKLAICQIYNPCNIYLILNDILLLTNTFKRETQYNNLSGSCAILHQLPRNCTINISNNYFHEEASVIAMTEWKCVYIFLITKID